jgi:hypothetical protein
VIEGEHEHTLSLRQDEKPVRRAWDDEHLPDGSNCPTFG